jgi:hypothetical protein
MGPIVKRFFVQINICLFFRLEAQICGRCEGQIQASTGAAHPGRRAVPNGNWFSD